MIQNISKYVSITDFLLLEYEFNRDGTTIPISSSGPTLIETTSGSKQYITYNLGEANNSLKLNSVPTNAKRSDWFNNYDDITQFNDYFASSEFISTTEYPHDTIKVHIISGYNFDDIAGFLLQIRAQDSSSNDYIDLSNFTYIKQPDLLGNNKIVKFSTNPLFLGNKFYDKYVEFKVPSVYNLGSDTTSDIATKLNVKQLSDVYLTYTTVPTIQAGILPEDNIFTLAEEVSLQLPVTSSADRFNAFIAESTVGDFIEFYATFDDQIIGQYMGDIESGRIPLYTSNNPNDNYQEFSDIYGPQAAKWVLIHEITVYEHFGASSILTQQYSFTQDSNFSSPNYFRPVLKNADIDSSFTIQYVCRLSNRMDGSQIIRRASFSSTTPKKYGLELPKINIENILPYKVFNRILESNPNMVQGNLKPKTKYVKVYYDTTEVVVNQNNQIFEQGLAPLELKNGDSVYKFKFERYNDKSDKRENVDLSGAFNYALTFTFDDDTTLEIGPTYSTNMNTTIGELEFKISKTQIDKLLNQENKNYSIMVKNPNGSSYNFYEGTYSSYQKRNENQELIQRYTAEISNLNSQISALQSENADLKEQNAELESNFTNKSSSTEQLGANTSTANTRDTNRRAGAEISIAGSSSPKSIVPSKEIIERDEIIKQLTKENELLLKEISKFSTGSYTEQRLPSRERPTFNGPEPIV